jgi:hypothetical protein
MHCYFRRGLDSSVRRAHQVLHGIRFSGPKVSAAATTGNRDMRQFGSLLRSTRSRIGRRLAEIIAIAAASLPAAGA